MAITLETHDVSGVDGATPTPAMRWALAGLSLSMLMPSLDTSIANVGLPTLARAFGATFQQVQWIVLAYLLAITTLILSAGRLGSATCSGAGDCCCSASRCSRWRRCCAARRPRSRC